MSLCNLNDDDNLHNPHCSWYVNIRGLSGVHVQAQFHGQGQRNPTPLSPDLIEFSDGGLELGDLRIRHQGSRPGGGRNERRRASARGYRSER
ncbi:hypothetical protein BHM03_00034284 [Ensete ventricosum]|nr:hypothetical protein BHM03_00034284 [Ensete ventricosum]